MLPEEQQIPQLNSFSGVAPCLPQKSSKVLVELIIFLGSLLQAVFSAQVAISSTFFILHTDSWPKLARTMRAFFFVCSSLARLQATVG